MVKFYPPREESEIDNSGEKFFYYELDRSLWPGSDKWYVFHGFNLASHITKAESEIDFLILTKWGLLMLEIKGGKVLYEDAVFYFDKVVKDGKTLFEKKKIQNPFSQVRTNFSSLQKLFYKEFSGSVPFMCTGVVFPYSSFAYNGVEYDTTCVFTADFNGTIRDFLEQCYTTSRRKKNWKGELSDEQMHEVVHFLKPHIITPNEKFLASESAYTTRFLQSKNVQILDGLRHNKRIMVQGPPGSGKSTYALAYIEKKGALEGKKGVYLCWNRFLARHIQNEIERRGLSENCEVIRYFQFVNFLMERAGSERRFTYDTPAGQYAQPLEEALITLRQKSSLLPVDFVIVDEAQDLFNRGLEKVLSNLTNQEGHITLSNFFLLYDIDQAFDKQVQATQEYIQSVSAHYSLADIVRSQNAIGIERFVKDVWNGNVEGNPNYGSEIEWISYHNEESLLSQIQNIRDNFFSSGVYGYAEAIMLVNSAASTAILKASLQFLSQAFQELHEDVLHQPEKKLYYTSSLSFKGLERKVVFLITSDFSTSLEKHETIIGASRAIAKLFIFHKVNLAQT